MTTENLTKTIERNILLNPGPATTTQAVKMAQVVPDICPREQEFGGLFDQMAQDCVDVVNGGSDYKAVFLGGSGTGAIESCLTSCTQEGEEILIIDNGAYGKRMAQICQAFKIPHSVIEFTWGDCIELQKVEQALANSKAKVLAFVHHETTVGVLNPLNELHQLAAKYGMKSVVDAMSSYAGIEIDLKATPVNYLISSSNKCIQGMAGIGIVIVKNETLEEIEKYPAKNFYFNLFNNYKNQKEKKQFLFTPPVQTVYALKEALKEFKEEGGIKARAKRYADLYQQMYNGMSELGFKPLVPPEFHAKILTAFLDPIDEQYHFDKMHDFLYEKGITIYPGKGAKENTFRISNIGDLTSKDIEIFLKSMEEYIKINNLKVS